MTRNEYTKNYTQPSEEWAYTDMPEDQDIDVLEVCEALDMATE